MKCLPPALLLAVVIATSPLAASADQAAATACAQKLDAPSKLIFDAVVANPQPGASLRDRVTAQTRSLVQAGKIDRSIARDKAMAAGQCLRLAPS